MSSAADKPRCCLSPAGDSVHLVQITDTHLCEAPGGTLLGMDTDRSLRLVVEQVLRERPHIDLVLATGDLSDRGSRSAYQRLVDYLGRLSAPSFWLPGNHDNRAEMAAVLAGTGELCEVVLAGRWQIVMLDSQIPGEVGGALGEAELQRLQAALADGEAQGLYTLVCLHHQPVPVGSQWLDEQMVADDMAFWELVEAHPGVRGVLWGHVHQQIDRRRGPVALMASPSTCVQFAPGSAGFKADDQPPGYRWLELRADGSIETAVSRVTDAEFFVELDSGGYL
ncbi:3',5'-cyclic-AMP phosphodiesterase [Mangrovimicrobium sediminis]|uniref:3',5'-cyclic-AMP phosphodiesterase n=2 Tax=Mangrovimicrobium sediminis TaxID=2562682 RepID=A0A4Z0M0P3_9GAMM|nr:3',5'-cyclic-AMP phosphodiesterase [Haliea sp. SAOS-164]